MQELHIDLETYSSADLIKYGVYKYAESQDFEVLLFAYSVDGGPVSVVDLAVGERIPPDIADAVMDPTVTKFAHNAQFERVCLSRHFHVKGYLPPEQWKCTMTWALGCGLPASLKLAGAALGIENQKLETGTSGITYFCKPYRGGRRYPTDNIEKWNEFKTYNKRDVEAELEIHERLKKIQELPPREWRLYWIDQRINDRGIRIDEELVHESLRMIDAEKERLLDEANQIEPGLNLNSTIGMPNWCKDHNIPLETLAKEPLAEYLATAPKGTPETRILEIRQLTSKTSLKKYTVLQNAQVGGRIRGLFQFNGAGRTGRWAGRMFQPQNIPRPIYEDHEKLRPLVKEGDLEALRAEYPNVMDAFVSVLRTALIPAEGKIFAVADYSAIECRVVAWLADEKWVLDAFARGEDIYCATASAMFGVPVEKHGVNGHLRKQGKVATLGCGYGGSIGALIAMGGRKQGMSDKDMNEAVRKWRKANPKICNLWTIYGNAAKKAIRTPGKVEAPHGVSFRRRGSCLYVELPTGRRLVYHNVSVADDGEIHYDGLQNKRWVQLSTWGGKIVENVTQAIARDCLAATLIRLEEAGLPVVGHIHDEVIVETDSADRLQELLDIMKTPIPWAPGLELKGEGFTGLYYRKD